MKINWIVDKLFILFLCFPLLSIAQQSKWFWQSPLPQANNLYGLYVFNPESVHIPVPFFVDVPVVVAITPLSIPFPVPVKFKPKVFPVTPPLNVNVPLPDASIVPPFVPNVNERSVVPEPLRLLPVYCNVPPLNTKLAAALVEAPILLAAPPLVNVLALKIPLEIEV